ncbi:MAG: glycosyltransferase family 9 protein, partial [Lentisphaerae bacterium]|nr:glycosyltransferase family 9 protein [Lentisphaerota bacterium]
FIVTLPALAALRRRWPGAVVELTGYPHIANLARLGGLADRVRSLDEARVARFFSLRPDFPPEQAEEIRAFDLVLSYLYDPHEVLRGNMERLGVKQLIYGSPIVEEGHAVEHMQKPLEALAIYPEPGERPELVLGRRRVRDAAQRLPAPGARVLALHPGSGSPKKNWPLTHFLELARRAREAYGLTPLFIHGEADRALVPEIAAAGVALWPTGPLTELAPVLAACAGYVGNDSGITHLAACVGTPTVALFGPSDAARWAPRGRRVAVLEADPPTPEGLAALSVDAVLEAVRETGGLSDR